MTHVEVLSNNSKRKTQGLEQAIEYPTYIKYTTINIQIYAKNNIITSSPCTIKSQKYELSHWKYLFTQLQISIEGMKFFYELID